ncbi:peptidylprolyl isomerase [Altererythrobacter arenosus]|uniref:Peptidylprolyl isomerase n=1 Tax=Altererythrobacter arenosus TaxID=3032592 RepID=A0ABY8FRU6_9SPHN|nr:peptidylprolyl isomerase [Altererythrobacter sp. CAU 1644]WFL77741.1 peptidylprolyl isomerase [Altererythrobacter sp. CAU 1644]
MKNLLMAAAATISLASPIHAQDEAAEAFLSPGEIVEQAAPEEWVAIPAEELLVMDLTPDREGNARRVIIQLMPAPFSQGWVENIKTLTRSGWFDGTAVIRVQDNYVVQWGDPAADEEGAKPLPEGLKVMEESEYSASTHIRTIGSPAPVTYESLRKRDELRLEQWLPSDPYSRAPFQGVKFHAGWPVAIDETQAWPVHCYGMVGVGRGMSPNTGDGSSLYTVIGHAPRHLDRNIALVGRIVEGMEHLSSLPRGHGPLGFYADDELDKRTEIVAVRMGNELEEFPQPQFEYLSTESESFAKYAEARANRRDPFFIIPAGGADICNIPVPIRAVPTE